jgi:hypothetical protein
MRYTRGRSVGLLRPLEALALCGGYQGVQQDSVSAFAEPEVGTDHESFFGFSSRSPRHTLAICYYNISDPILS